jgi:phosphohistidine phosphatase
MLTLAILRHAKSDWDDPALADHDRPLASRGRKAAPAVGRFLRKAGLVPDLVLCSTARRAVETLERVLPEIDADPIICHERDLYLASAARLLGRLRRIAEPAELVLLVGHDPGLHELAVGLAGTGTEAELAALAAKLPTGGLVVVDFPVDHWRKVAAGAGTLRLFVTPRELG